VACDGALWKPLGARRGAARAGPNLDPPGALQTSPLAQSSCGHRTFRDEGGRVSEQVLFREDEARLAWLFDPFLAVQTSNLEPLPHQIDAAIPSARRLD
jgi:hypothetical protein